MNLVNSAFQELEICNPSTLQCLFAGGTLMMVWGNLLKFELPDCLDFFFQGCQHWAQNLYVNQAWNESWVCIVAVQHWTVVLEAHDLIVLGLQTLCHILSSVGSTPQAALQNLLLLPLPVVALRPLLLHHLMLPIQQSPPICSSC
jgi:hypothetical protein